MSDRQSGPIEDKRSAGAQSGIGLVVARSLDSVVQRALGLRIVHVLALESNAVRPVAADLLEAHEFRFLDAEEVARFAADPTNELGPDFAARARQGLDFCFGAICGGRLAGYAWYALGSVERRHAAGADLELPIDTAYLYKAFTHPEFRGRRLYPASMAEALSALAPRGIERLIAFVHWSNTPAMHSCEVAGCRSLGRMIVGPRGPLSVPIAVREMGLRLGTDATVVARR